MYALFVFIIPITKCEKYYVVIKTLETLNIHSTKVTYLNAYMQECEKFSVQNLA